MEWNESKSLSKFIWVNGKFIPWEEGYAHVLTHSLHYSGAVYEGERAYNGKVFKLEEHTNRLLKSAELMHLDVKYSAEEINQATKDVLAKNGLQNAYVRPLIWRGAESLSIYSENLSTNLLIFAVDSNPRVENNLKLQLGPWRKPSENSIPPQAKSSAHYAMMSISQKIAQENGYDDALLLDSHGAVAESSVANIFFVKNGELITPIADRFLNGITRQTVFEIAKKLGIKAKEQRIYLEDLKSCESCFICGTSAEIKGVSLIDNNGEIIKFASDEITIILQKEYAKLTGKIL